MRCHSVATEHTLRHAVLHDIRCRWPRVKTAGVRDVMYISCLLNSSHDRGVTGGLRVLSAVLSCVCVWSMAVGAMGHRRHARVRT